MLGVTPVPAEALLPVGGSVDTLPLPSSNGVAPVGAVATGPADAEYGGALAATADVVESADSLPSGAGIGGETAGALAVVVE